MVHGATIGRNRLVGMNAVIMDNVLGDECITGGRPGVPESRRVFERRSLIVGNPAKNKRGGDEMIRWKTEGTAYTSSCPNSSSTVGKNEPLRSIPTDRTIQSASYKPGTKANDQSFFACQMTFSFFASCAKSGILPSPLPVKPIRRSR